MNTDHPSPPVRPSSPSGAPSLDASFHPPPATAASPDPLTAGTVAQLESPSSPRTWTQTLWVLLFTLLIFGAAGFFSYTPTDLAILLAVLFFHESGHYLGMRIFNYRDVRMFFIPFFGAAVSGRSTSVEGYKEAIVILLGPLPGILLGLVLGIVCLFYDSGLLRTAAGMLLFINGFNLFPFYPLDGGRLLHLVLFCRQRYLEAAFRAVTGALLAVTGWFLSAWLLAILGAWMLLTAGFQFRVRTLARDLRAAVLPSATDPSAPIAHESASLLVERACQAFPQIKQPKSLANVVRQVWEAIHVRPPSIAASVGLLSVYGLALCGAPILCLFFIVPWPRIVWQTKDDGTQVRAEEVRVWGRLRESTGLDEDNRPHGRHVEFLHSQGGLAVEGTYVHGHRDGTWKFYGQDGLIRAERDYERGELARQRGEIPSGQGP